MPLIATIAPTQSNVQAALSSFLLSVLPEPSSGSPSVFTGSITGTTLTVNQLLAGSAPIALNSGLLGAAPGTLILSQLTGATSGGPGTYQLSTAQTTDVETFATGVLVIAGQPNRAVEPNNPWFVVMTPILSTRLGTNQDSTADCKFTGSIAGTTLTVSAVQSGAIAAGATVFTPGIAANTIIVQQLTGPAGGAGTYQVSPSQNLGSATMSAGAKTMMASDEMVVQLDFHSPDYLSGDLAKTVSIALRDELATTFFSALSAPLNSVSPLYADDPKQISFINAENQFEWRWSLDAHLQVDATISTAVEYADAVAVTLHEVP